MKKLLAVLLSGTMLLCGSAFMAFADPETEAPEGLEDDDVGAIEFEDEGDEGDEATDETGDEGDDLTSADDDSNVNTGVEFAIIPAAAALVVLVVLGVAKKKEEVA